MFIKQKIHLLLWIVVMVFICYLPMIIGLQFFVEMGFTVNAWAAGVFLPTLSYLLMILLSGRAAKKKPALAGTDRVWRRKGWSELLGMVLLSLAVITANISIGYWLTKAGIQRANPVWHVNRTLQFAFFSTVGLVLLGPIAEEIFWRGNIQDCLTRIFGSIPAMIIQAMAFAFCHFRYSGDRLSIFAVGIILGLWRWKKRTLLPVIVAHIALNAWVGVSDWQDRRELAGIRPTVDYVAELNRISQPMGGDPNDNAAPLYMEAFALGVAMPDEVSFNTYKRWPGTWSGEQNTVIRNWIAANAESLEFVRRGSKKGHYHKVYRGRDMFGLVESELPMARDLSFALSARFRVRALDGDVGQAFSDVLMCCRYGLHFRGPKPTMEQLFGLAISAISVEKAFLILHEVEPDEDLWETLQMEMEAILAGTDHRFDFRVERLCLYDAIQRVFTDDGKGGGTLVDAAVKGTKNPPRELEFLFDDMNIDGWKGLDRAQTAELVEAVFDIADTLQRKSPYQRKVEGIDLQAVLNDMTRDNGFVHTLLLDAGKVTAMTYQFQSHLQALITTLAVQRYHMHSGSPPGNLQDLVAAGFLDALHDDPFGDQPLHYRLTDGHFILYSNGFDCDDDGGVHDKKWGRDGDGDFVFWPVMVEGRTQ